MIYTRRQMVEFVGGVVASLYGRPAQSYLQARPPARIVLVLDGTEGVEVVYHGERILVPPQEVMDALRRK